MLLSCTVMWMVLGQSLMRREYCIRAMVLSKPALHGMQRLSEDLVQTSKKLISPTAPLLLQTVRYLLQLGSSLQDIHGHACLGKPLPSLHTCSGPALRSSFQVRRPSASCRGLAVQLGCCASSSRRLLMDLGLRTAGRMMKSRPGKH